MKTKNTSSLKNNIRCFKSALNQLCSSLWTSCVFALYILADLISFLEIQRLQLAGSSSTVFAANLIPSLGPVSAEAVGKDEKEKSATEAVVPLPSPPLGSLRVADFLATFLPSG